ncbi:MAG: Fic/DOC family protein [Succinivibrio sp.]
MSCKEAEGVTGLSGSYGQAMGHALEWEGRLGARQFLLLKAVVNSHAAEGLFLSRQCVDLLCRRMLGECGDRECALEEKRLARTLLDNERSKAGARDPVSRQDALEAMDDTARIVALMLSNKQGLEDFDDIDAVQALSGSLACLKFYADPPSGNIGYVYLKAIHRRLFSKVWPWAGKDRRDLGLKGGFRKVGGGSFVPSPDVARKAAEVFAQRRTDRLFACRSAGEFGIRMGDFWNDVNLLHPFIDGNGRSTRLLLAELSRRAGIRFMPDLIEGGRIIEASIEGAAGNAKPFHKLVEEAVASCSEDLEVFSRNEATLRRGRLEIVPLSPWKVFDK